MRLFVYDMLVNVNVIYYVHVCKQARWARSAGNSAIENLCIIIIIILLLLLLLLLLRSRKSITTIRGAVFRGFVIRRLLSATNPRLSNTACRNSNIDYAVMRPCVSSEVLVFNYGGVEECTPVNSFICTRLTLAKPMKRELPTDFTDKTNSINRNVHFDTCHSSGAVWESKWTSWAVRPNEPSGFRGRKDLLNRASALVTTCP